MTLRPPYWKYDVMFEIRLQSIDAYSLEEQSGQISSRSDLKRRSLRRFGRGRPNTKKKKKLSSDIGSVPGPKTLMRCERKNVTDV